MSDKKQGSAVSTVNLKNGFSLNIYGDIGQVWFSRERLGTRCLFVGDRGFSQ